MKYIALIAVIGIVLLQLSGSVPDSSVGGPMTLALAFLIAALAVGIHEAWTARRGVLGWIVSIVAAFIGGLAAAMLGGTLMDMILPFVHVDGSLAQSHHPLLYISAAAMMLLTLLGSWLAL